MTEDRAEHANTFYEILKGLPDVNYYLIRGGVGERVHYEWITVGHAGLSIGGGLEDRMDSPNGFKVQRQ